MDNHEHTTNIILEQGVWLGESVLWKRVGEFYQDKGISAWNGNVPYQVTSNPRIAVSYVETILAFLEDWVEQNGPFTQPCRIIEVGAGHGNFSLMMLRVLAHKQAHFQALGISVQYIITDLAASNVEEWKRNAFLKDWLHSGHLQVTVFDGMTQSELFIDSKPVEFGDAPSVFIANYLFDSLPHEAFLLKDNTLQRAKTLLTTHPDKTDDPQKWMLSLDFEPCSWDDLAVSTAGLLREYEKIEVEGCILLPVGAISCIENLRYMSQDRFLLLCSDKGLSSQNSIKNRTPAEITAFVNASMIVNLHALMLYFQHEGGCAWMQTTQQEFLASAAYGMGVNPLHTHRTNRAFSQQLDKNSPGDLYSLSTQLINHRFTLSLGNMISLLKLMEWDPAVFENLHDAIFNYLPSAQPTEISDLVNALPLIAAYRYAIPGSGDTLFRIAHLLQTLQQWQAAIDIYQSRIEEQGETAEVLYNLGLCYNAMEKTDLAITSFERAVQLNPDFLLAQGWLYKFHKLHNLPGSNS